MSKFEEELHYKLAKHDTLKRPFYYADGLIDTFKDWQPPKKLVVVPQFVADWFEENEYDLDYRIWKYIRDWDKQQRNVFYKWFNKDDRAIETLVRMKLDGYTIEKEQLYVIEYPMTLNPYVSDMGKNQYNQIIISGYTSVKASAKRFTEKEIKVLDERLMAFAVKVDEVDVDTLEVVK